MINKRSIQACADSQFGPFSKPLYDSYCFSRIPETIRTLLTDKKGFGLPEDTYVEQTYDFVLTVLIDSFGWQYFEKFAPKYPFLQRFLDLGIVSKVTAQFPSTTTNHITCMHTGLSVGQSGLYEWFYYEPLVDACICPLHFSFAQDKNFNTLANAGIFAKDIFPFRSIYQDFNELGIKSLAFQEKDTAKSPFSQIIYQGAELKGFNNFSEGLTQLTKAISRQQEKSYFFLYFGEIDGAGHEFGPNSDQVAKKVDKCFTMLELHWEKLSKTGKKGCIIVTADHGMAEIQPETTWFINKHLPHFERYIRQNKKGELLVPCGASRDMFLHIKDDMLDDAHNELKQALNGIAEVYKTEELVRLGLFGEVSDRFLERVGNLVILPLGQNTVWWYDPNIPVKAYRGHHGGLTPTELETIFLFQELK